MLKRIRHYEEEKDLLLDGLHAVEKAQEWYFKQIALVQEKMKCLGRGDTHLVSEFIGFCLSFLIFHYLLFKKSQNEFWPFFRHGVVNFSLSSVNATI